MLQESLLHDEADSARTAAKLSRGYEDCKFELSQWEMPWLEEDIEEHYRVNPVDLEHTKQEYYLKQTVEASAAAEEKEHADNAASRSRGGTP
eukprot:gene8382-9961_t